MKIATKSFLRLVVNKGARACTATDTPYKISAITTTMSRFGPSGSLKSEKNIFEHTRAVTPRISNEVFFDMEYIDISIVKNVPTGTITRCHRRHNQ